MLATAPNWDVDVERGPDWLLIRVKGSDKAGDATPHPPPLAESLWSLCQRHFTYRLVLELDQIGLLNSHLIGQLVQLYRRIREHDGVLRLCGLSAYNLRVLDTCRLQDRLCACRNREEAVLGCGGPRQPR